MAYMPTDNTPRQFFDMDSEDDGYDALEIVQPREESAQEIPDPDPIPEANDVFALMVIDRLRELNDEQRDYARGEIIKTLDRAKTYDITMEAQAVSTSGSQPVDMQSHLRDPAPPYEEYQGFMPGRYGMAYSPSRHINRNSSQVDNRPDDHTELDWETFTPANSLSP